MRDKRTSNAARRIYMHWRRDNRADLCRVHTDDAHTTKLDSFVASAVCVGLDTKLID